MLESSLETERADGGLRLTLRVENDGDDPVTLQFRSGQRVEFVARDGDDEVWRYSSGRMFTQALGSETVAPGESASYEATWSDPPAGEYDVAGDLAAENVTATAEATVSVS